MKSPLSDFQNLNSSDVSQLWQLSQLYRQLGKIQASLSFAYNAIQKETNSQQRYRNYYLETIRLGAEFAEEIEDYPRAVYYWEQLVQQQPDNFSAWYGLGLAKANIEDYQGAEMALTRAFQLEPTHQKVRSHLAEIQQLLTL